MANKPASDKEGRPAGGAGNEPPGGGGGSPPPGKKPDFALHEHIGGQLRAMFDEVVEAPVPDKFRELLEQLERKQPKEDG